MATRNIVDQMKLIYGPRDLLARYIGFADGAARDLGIRLRLAWDFDRLYALNAQHSDSWPRLSPIFNPEYNTITSENAFFIEGVDEYGDTVVTSAARLYDHGDRSDADDLRSLRVFYETPEPHIAAGNSVDVTAPSAEHIYGRVMFSGSVWVRPDYRRHGLTRIIPRLTRSYALTQWNTPVFWGVVEYDLDEMGVTRAYGSWHAENRIATHMPSWRDDLDFLFLSMGQATLIRDIARSAYEVGTTSRWIDSAIANRSSPDDRQGMSTRS
jgi:GNAT superfamily N-acetyltransferase